MKWALAPSLKLCQIWQNFVGMCMDIFMGIGKFCGYCGKFCWVCENLFVPEVMGIFSWTCRNFLFAWLWQNLVVVWICDKFGSGDTLVGH